ncbi:MAG: radical SAM protein [Methanomassiliicoccales archaeon]|nr:MAG: radical SAM protein [Methanomassiliicoccales archaeon]
MNCSYCHLRRNRAKHENMTFYQIKLILDNFMEYAEERRVERFKIGLVGGGEPLLQFDLIKKIINYSKRCDLFSFYTITNGTLVTEEILSFFKEEKNKINLNFSLDGYRELHNLCRKGHDDSGSFDVVMDAVKRYTSMFGEEPIINCTVHAKTIEMREKVFHFFKSNGFNRVCFSRMIGGYDLGLNISTESFEHFLLEALVQGFDMRQLQKMDSYDCTVYGMKCGVGRTNIFYANGNIFPCGRFINLEDYVIGQYDTPIQDVELNMKRFHSNSPNQCYYDSHIAEQKTFPLSSTNGREEAL